MRRTSAAGLQAQLDKLEAFAYAWGLTVNAGKTKVMVVESMQRRRPQVGGTAAPAPSFTCGLSTMELVEEFTYLGTAVHAQQGFVYAAGPRAEKGRKAKHAPPLRRAGLAVRACATAHV